MVEETKKTKAVKQACRVCGAEFAGARQVARVAKKVNLPDEVAQTCPACRRKDIAGKIERILVGKRPVDRA